MEVGGSPFSIVQKEMVGRALIFFFLSLKKKKKAVATFKVRRNIFFLSLFLNTKKEIATVGCYLVLSEPFKTPALETLFSSSFSGMSL